VLGLSLVIPAMRTGGQYVSAVAFVAAAWLAGQGTRRWRATSDRLRSALDELDAPAVLRERGAVDEERARIARELHDVVGHSISVMVLQAGAARLELQPEQTRAREQLEAVEQAGRAAMVEMRRMVGVMRPDQAAPLAAPPSIQRLEPLLRQMREAGLDVSLRVTGPPQSLPPGLDLTAYRIVQEALTNVARHAGPVPVTVEIVYQPDALRLEVRNQAAAAPPAAAMGERRTAATASSGCANGSPCSVAALTSAPAPRAASLSKPRCNSTEARRDDGGDRRRPDARPQRPPLDP
jgi:signal transduction histidine kinase